MMKRWLQHAGGATPPLLPYGKAVRDAYFQFAPGTVYFNHGGYGATPRPVQQAMLNYTRQMESQPTKWFGAHGYHSEITSTRAKLAPLVQASVQDLVFVDNASAGMNAVLRSLKWAPGDIVLIFGSVYPVIPNTVAWLVHQYRIDARQVHVQYPIKGDDNYVQPLRAALSNFSAAERLRVRLVCMDYISSYPTVILPVVELTHIVKTEARNAFVFVDGAHALGQIHVNLSSFDAAGVDAVVMDGHKWLMSPHGSALLWVARRAQKLLVPDVISSDNAVSTTSFHDQFDYIGTRDYGPWIGMVDALTFRDTHLGGEQKIVSYLHSLAVWAAAMLETQWDTEVVAPANMTAGLITVRLPIPKSWSAKAQAACAAAIAGPEGGLVQRYQMQVIPFPLPLDGLGPVLGWWARISAQVYLSRQDFYALANHTLTLAQECSSEELVA
jgi:selenocysteine lyase/cysteine desulfurase